LYVRRHVFNYKRGIGFYKWKRPGKTCGSKVSHNTAGAMEEDHRLVMDVNFIVNKTNFAKLVPQSLCPYLRHESLLQENETNSPEP
jgi:hypothetical protein